MSTQTDEKRSPIHELSLEEARELFDQQARKYLGISGDEFIRRFEAGEYEDRDHDSDIVMLAMLMPVAR